MLRGLALIALCTSAAAPAQPVTSSRTIAPSQAKNDPNRIVCQKEDKIGSRLGGKKVCLPYAEWQKIAADGRDQTERVQSGTTVCGNADGGCPTGTAWDNGPH